MSEKPSWVKRHSALIAWAPAGISLLGAAASWYFGFANVAATREAVIAEHRPVLEITSFGYADKGNMPVHMKNSGRSTAFKVRTDIVFDVGNYPSQNPPAPPKFTPTKTFDSLHEYSIDVPSGGTSEFNLVTVPSLQYLKAYEGFTDDMSVRLRGAVHYEDSSHNKFELPFCYESFQPIKLDKPGAIPCFDIQPFPVKSTP